MTDDRKVSVNWEPIARTLRDHQSEPWGNYCTACRPYVDFPCPDWTRASEALDD